LMSNHGLNACSGVSLIAYGLYVEPIIHPKPGAVTILRPHADKDVLLFAEHASIAEVALYEACMWAYRGLKSPIARGLSVYRGLVEKFGIKTNVALGSVLLATPIAVALSRMFGAPVSSIVGEARRVVYEETGSEEAAEYYRLLEYFKPSHLGRYTGPIPGVGEGYARSFVEVLRVASWDLVHRELLEGYPVTLQAYNIIASRREPLPELFLRTLLELLATHGDTLIAAKYGFTAYRRAKAEALEALKRASEWGVYEAVEWLDRLWRPRGWNPGAVLDILAVTLGLVNYGRTLATIEG